MKPSLKLPLPFDAPGWIGDERADGMGVFRSSGGPWLVRSRSKTVLLWQCPCCDRPFPSAHMAKLVCNIVFPLGEDDEPEGDAA